MKEFNEIKIDNAIILAAGYASRFTPISDICPKALLLVKGEILIERQIRQLLEANIPEVYVVTGYKKELFTYLENKYPVKLIENKEYESRNNHSSIYAARKHLKNSYICSADNYFPKNPFTPTTERPFYSALYGKGPTDEYCLTTDSQNRITDVVIGGHDSWYMLGHVCVDNSFSEKFLEYLEAVYPLEETKPLLWEHLYMQHLDTLTLYMKKYPAGAILEFDTLTDLAAFDPHYATHSLPDLLSWLSHYPEPGHEI